MSGQAVRLTTGIHAPACLKLCRSHRFGAPGTPVQSPGTFQLKSVHQDSAGVASRRRLRAPSEPWGSKKRPRRAKFKAVAHERTHHGCGLAGVDGASPDAGPEVSHIRLAKTLAAIDSLGRHLSGIPGRKNLVWIGAGISISSVTGALGTGPHGSIETFEDKVKRTSQKLAQQGVVLYVVDAKGLEVARSQSAESAGTLPMRGRGRFEAQQDSERLSDDTFPAMDMMSSMTGGRYLRNSNDLAAGFKSAAVDLAGSYTLGFYVSDEPDNKWHTLKASVKRSGVELRHRKGYLAEPITPVPTLWTNQMAMAAVSDPVGSSAVQLTAYCGPSPDAEAGTVVANLQIEPGVAALPDRRRESSGAHPGPLRRAWRQRRNTTDERRPDDHDPNRQLGRRSAGRSSLFTPVEAGAGRGVGSHHRPRHDDREVRNAGRSAQEASCRAQVA